MAGFFKQAIRNFVLGPTTDPYPFGETFLPETYRGILTYDSDLCIGCSTCEHVCPTNAIKVEEKEDGSGISFAFWMNTCTFCGNCVFFCPTKAITQAPNFHTARPQDEKYELTANGEVNLVKCAECDKMIPPFNEILLERAYGEVTDEIRMKAALCPDCRRRLHFERLYL